MEQERDREQERDMERERERQRARERERQRERPRACLFDTKFHHHHISTGKCIIADLTF